MSPSDFTFKLTVPNDPEGASVVAVVATHAIDYTNIDKAAGASFVDQVRAFAAHALKSAAAGKSSTSETSITSSTYCQVVFAAANGQLTITIGTESVSHPLPS
jgi:hypothetical protein